MDEEELRQRTIAAYGLADRDREAAFDRVTELACDHFQVPIAVVTVLTRERMLFQGACGIEGGAASESAFCNITVRQAEPLVIPDAAADPRFRDNPLVTGEPHIRFYAGAPILIGDGVAVGALCLIDQQPRDFGPAQRRRLTMLAATVADLMEARVDQTLAREREADFKRQSDLLRTMVNSIDQGLAYFDGDLRLVMWNRLFFELHGFGREWQYVGLPAEDLLREATRRGMFGAAVDESAVPAVMESIRTEPERRIEIQVSDGRILDSLRTRLPDGSGFILTARDLTAERAGKALKDEFVATVSHELRTPLTSIRGALALLGRAAGDKLDARGRQMLDMAQRNADRLSTLIDDILDVERLETGSITFIMLPIDLRETLSEAVAQNRTYAEPLQVGLELELPDRPLPVCGDPGRLLQVLCNLLSNAAKFSPRGGQVRVVGERQGSCVKVRVIDQGSGVPEGFEQRLFQRFAPGQQRQAVGTQRHRPRPRHQRRHRRAPWRAHRL